jgi:hypothetical protein
MSRCVGWGGGGGWHVLARQPVARQPAACRMVAAFISWLHPLVGFTSEPCACLLLAASCPTLLPVQFPGFQPRYHSERSLAAAAAYGQLAKAQGLTLAQLALAWCKSRWWVMGTVVGSRCLLICLLQLPVRLLSRCERPLPVASPARLAHYALPALTPLLTAGMSRPPSSAPPLCSSWRRTSRPLSWTWIPPPWRRWTPST